MVFLTNNDFIVELQKLYESNKNAGHVDITMKQYNESVNCTPSKRQEPDLSKNQCLIRATYKDKKISTLVENSNVAEFGKLLNSTMKSCLTNLRVPKEKLAKEKPSN
ncbi:hypothetical protein WA158_006278 [Blastocystis sp. Blastoise]